MDQDPGGVEDAAERRPARRGELLGQPLTEVARLAAGANLLAGALEQRPRRRHGERIVHAPHELVHRGEIAKPHADECRAAAADTLSV